MARSQPFGALLRRHRVLSGLTQEALAERSRLSVRAIGDLERGVNRTPQPGTLLLLAEALQLAGEERAQFEAAARAEGRGMTPAQVLEKASASLSLSLHYPPPKR